METVQVEKIVTSHFFLHSSDQKDIQKEVLMKELLDQKQAESVLKLYGKQIKALNDQVPATYLSSKLGIICSAYITMLGLHQVILPIPNSLSIQFYQDEKYQVDTIAFKVNIDNCYYAESHKESRREQLANFFETFITPLIINLSKTVNIRLRELWGQLLHGIEYGRKIALDLTANEREKILLDQDYHWLIKEANPSIFQSEKHVLDFPYMEVQNPTSPCMMQRMKPTCCLYYQTEGAHGKCYTCPRMTPAEREKRKQEVLASVK
ncbi:(2Fe-2S)-binding protein [Halalkalibacter kiskunsagensis]|uniref:(2Fe-2S)-binding protein n=1 Tax=Halalkalibacter kiskunsagensis TaxID=1548599 RepID=A0ABV6KG18_9BACI